MRTNFVIIILIISYVQSLYPQQWERIDPIFNPSDTINFSKGIFINETTGYATQFYPAQIWKTENEGKLWSLLKAVDTAWFHNMDFISAEHGCVLGENIATRKHFLLKTNDGGFNWLEIVAPKVFNISFQDSNDGFAVGSSIYKTIDGGFTWIQQNIDTSVHFSAYSIFFANSITGWVTGSSSEYIDGGIVLKSSDGGENWSINAHPIPNDGSSIFFRNYNFGIIAGSNQIGGNILITTDAGITWEYKEIGQRVRDVYLIDDSVGYIVGDYGLLAKTTNNGDTWEKIDLSTEEKLNKILFINGVGFILGNKNTIFRTTNTTSIQEVKNNSLLSDLFYSYPNPFNLTTTIAYTLKEKSNVSLTVYDILGRELEVLVNETQEAGEYKVPFSASHLASGVYLYRLRVDDKTFVKKMLMMK
jgi:photosystem II stability/assembly factor-like uncharacterized protein